MNSQEPWTSPHQRLANCLSLDLEVSPDTNTIQAIAAYRPDTQEELRLPRGQCLQPAAARRLDSIAQGARFLLGHNIHRHDLPHLQAAHPQCTLLRMPVVDTLHLNPLAFPRHPYHHLVKHYKDGDLVREVQNDPLLDCQVALQAFHNQLEKLQDTQSELLTAWHHITSQEEGDGYDLVFRDLRNSHRPEKAEAARAITGYLDGKACLNSARAHSEEMVEADRWPTAFALAWISTEGGNSSAPPWVLYTYPQTMAIIEKLRDRNCGDRDCPWCCTHNSATGELRRWFGFNEFRPEPAGEDGKSLQQAITEKAMSRQHALGILPTGTGKSLCYQIPGLSKYDATGKLTVVISPLVALMADQIRGLQEKGITSADTINGMLTMPERSAALERVRQGQTAILLTSPEQLRNRTVAEAIAQRAVATWVIDESHCLAQWGHDFRPDYRYIGRFMRSYQVTASDPTILCLTATAKPEVKQEIVDYFWKELGLHMDNVDGGAQRRNLEFTVMAVTEATRMDTIHQLVGEETEANPGCGVIVYCQTRRDTEQTAEALTDMGIPADHFHSTVTPERKREIQEAFTRGESDVIIATSAFGMGIDRDNVSAVIHASVPGSLENYIQEAGRAGRDGRPARCVLLYQADDIERQFRMNARNRLDRKEIQAVLKALRSLKRRIGPERDVEVTTGELLKEDQDQEFQRDSLGGEGYGGNDDTRVRTAVAWLEDAELVERTHNASQVYASSLQVKDRSDAQRLLDRAGTLDEVERRQANAAVGRMIQGSPSDVISSDEMCMITGGTSQQVATLFAKLRELGIVNRDISMTAYVNKGRNRPSIQRFNEANGLETDLIRHLQERAPNQQPGETEILNLRAVNQAMRDLEHNHSLPEFVSRMLRSMANDGATSEEEENGPIASARGSIRVRARGQENLAVTLNRSWSAVERGAEMRRLAALRILELLLRNASEEPNRADILVETSQGQIDDALRGDLELNRMVNDYDRLRRSALLWLHEQDVIRLNTGFSVLRHAMTVNVPPSDRRQFNQGDYEPLKIHYDHQTLQVHIIAEYGEQGLRERSRAAALAADYFTMNEESFIAKWLRERQDLKRQTSRQSYQDIVGSLGNRAQRTVVTDDRDTVNTLVLAGPGSGKTKTLVHRIAHLVRVQRVKPDSIIALAYNRHAAVQIRQQLEELIGNEAQHVRSMTLHALAMRLTGRSFADRSADAEARDFDEVLNEASRLLEGQEEAVQDNDGERDEVRERLLQGYRWMLVDEYQDITESHYRLLTALAGRARQADEHKLNILAVGDDDQNIYGFQGSSNEYIRRFQADYSAGPGYLTENYRSTSAIIRAANRIIESCQDRMKHGRPITVNRSRSRDPAGGRWTSIDPVARGRVQLITCRSGREERQAMVVVAELRRLQALDRQNWNWSRCAVIARHWQDLDPVRSMCMLEGIETQLAREDLNTLWPLRETQELLRWAEQRPPGELRAASALIWLEQQETNPWNDILANTLRLWLAETDNTIQSWPAFREWMAEWCHDNRQRQHGLLLTSAHSAKGLEFDHVVILDGRWEQLTRREDRDAGRRLYYVAMTRARETLTLMDAGLGSRFTGELALAGEAESRESAMTGEAPPELRQRYHRLSLKDIYLGYPGHFDESHRIHRVIAATQPGDPLNVDTSSEPWTLQTEDGTRVGRLARQWRPPEGHEPLRAQVLAVARWDADKSDPEYRERFNCQHWEVVIPEIVTESAR